MEGLKTSKGYIKLNTASKKPVGELLLKKLEDYLSKQGLNLEDLKLEDLEKEKILLPSILYKELQEYIKRFENMSEKEINELPDDVRMLLLKLGDTISPIDGPSNNYLYTNDVTKKPLESESVVNEIEYNDKQYGIVYPSIKKIKNEASFLIELQEGVGLGKMTKIILWNSGFWITIRPPQNEDLINLYTKLTKEIENVAEDTTLLGFSNISSVFYKVAWEYVLEHLVDSSLNVNPKHLGKYVSILDMDTILLGILSQIFYNGFTTTLLCKNNYVLDENNNPKCNFAYEVTLDLPKLLWVDTSRLDTEMMTIISKRGPKTQDVNEIKAYQNKLKPKDSRAIINLNNGKKLELTLTIPNIVESFNTSELFLMEIKKSINKALADVPEEERENLESLKARFLTLANKSLFLGIYSHFVEKMKLEEFETTNRSTIIEALKTLSSNPKDVNSIIEKIHNFITVNSITTIAVPDFICPVCGASQSDEPTFEHLVPINMVNYFFTLSKLRFMKLLLEKPGTE